LLGRPSHLGLSTIFFNAKYSGFLQIFYNRLPQDRYRFCWSNACGFREQAEISPFMDYLFKGFSPLFRLYELRLFPKEGIGIIGAAKPHHLDEAVKALQVNLNREEIAVLEELYQPHPILGSD
jgi:hypothetical protein